MPNNRYPKIHILSKNELGKHISSIRLPAAAARALIDDVLDHYDRYWNDHPTLSQAPKGKWVRNASGTKLGTLLKHMDSKILKPYDPLLPGFVFGGISGLNHKAAVQQLLGKRRKRVLLKLDISKFFEQVRKERVKDFFQYKGRCSEEVALLLADLCCVPYGPKDNPERFDTIARGFPTSPRLAVWCNLDAFIKIERIVKKSLKGKDPRIAVYVDDIGITASGASLKEMMSIYPKIKKVLEEGDRNQKLPLNIKKTKIIFHSGDTYGIDGVFQGKWSFEHLGLQMGRNKLSLGTKTRWKLSNLTHSLRQSKGKDKTLRKKRKSIMKYKNYILK